jgi:hypothetical protein
MGVDGIGRGGSRPIGSAGPGEPGGIASGSADPARGAAARTNAESVSGSTALERLERGEIDLDGYLDARVDNAIQHLEGRLPASQVDFIRQSLREELASDPVLVELVRRTTGALPTPSAE